MKRSIHIIMIAVLSLCSLGCQTGPKEVPSDMTDKYIGKYLCKEITFLEGKIAMREGLEASSDLYAQCTGAEGVLYNGVVEGTMTISPVREYDSDMLFYMRIPLQDITYYKVDGYRPAGTYCCETLTGNDTSVTFAYNVNRSGKVNFKIIPTAERNPVYREDDRIIEHLDSKYVEAKSIEADGKGTIKAVIQCGFYDYATGQLVVGPVEYVYERVSYRI